MSKHFPSDETTHANGLPAESKAGNGQTLPTENDASRQPGQYRLPIEEPLEPDPFGPIKTPEPLELPGDTEELIRRWFRLYAWIPSPDPKSEAMCRADEYDRRLMSNAVLPDDADPDGAARQAELDLLNLQLRRASRIREFCKITEKLAEAAEQHGIDSTAYFALIGNIEGASVAEWDAAWAVTKRLKARSKADEPPADQDQREATTAHADDFRSVKWFGTEFYFTPIQAACVALLWENWERGTPDVGEQTILLRAESDQGHLRAVFDKGRHPAWGNMILPGQTKGSFRLVKPVA